MNNLDTRLQTWEKNRAPCAYPLGLVEEQDGQFRWEAHDLDRYINFHYLSSTFCNSFLSPPY